MGSSLPCSLVHQECSSSPPRLLFSLTRSYLLLLLLHDRCMHLHVFICFHMYICIDTTHARKTTKQTNSKKKKNLFPASIDLATFRVLSERDTNTPRELFLLNQLLMRCEYLKKCPNFVIHVHAPSLIYHRGKRHKGGRKKGGGGFALLFSSLLFSSSSTP